MWATGYYYTLFLRKVNTFFTNFLKNFLPCFWSVLSVFFIQSNSFVCIFCGCTAWQYCFFVRIMLKFLEYRLLSSFRKEWEYAEKQFKQICWIKKDGNPVCQKLPDGSRRYGAWESFSQSPHKSFRCNSPARLIRSSRCKRRNRYHLFLRAFLRQLFLGFSQQKKHHPHSSPVCCADCRFHLHNNKDDWRYGIFV